MLRLKPEQRAALGETVRDLAHLSAGALALGQFVGQQPASWWMLLADLAIGWFWPRVGSRWWEPTMVNALLLLSGITLVVSVVVLLDWLGGRKDRESKRRPAA